MDFEKSMSNVSALSGATGKDLKELEHKAREMGSKTSKTAKDAADAMGYMALAGWKQKQIISGIEPVLRLAEAGNLDLAKASSLTTDSLSAMGLTVKDLPHYLDVVAQSARSSNTDIGQMMEAYIGVGGTMKSLNIPLNESAIAIDILANKGIKGSEAATALTAVINNLTAPAGKASDAIEALGKKFGFKVFDKATGKFRGLSTVLFELKKCTKGMNDEQKNAILSAIGGKEHIKDLNALLNGLDTDYVKLKGNIKNAGGALNNLAKIMQDNNAGSITQLSSAIQELGLKIYDVLRPSIANLTKKIKGFVDKLNELTPAQQESIVNFAKWALIIGPVILGVSKIGKSISNTITSINRLTRNIKKAGGIMQWLTSPGHLVVLGLLAIVVVAALVITHWKQICEFTNKVKKTLINLKNNALDKVKKAFDETKKKIKKFKDALKDAEPTIKRVAKVLGAIFGPALVKTGTKAIIAGTRIMGHFVASIIKTGSQAVVNGIKLTVSFIGAIIKTGAQAVVAGARLTTTFIAAIIKTGAQAAKTAIIITGKLIVAIAKYALEGWRAVGAIIAQTAAWLFQKGVVIAHTIALVAHKIATIGLTAVTKGLTLAQWALNSAFLASPIGWIVLGIGLLVIAVIGLCKAWKENWGGIQEKTKAVIDKIKEWWGNLKEFLKHPIQGTINLLKTGNVKGEVKGKNALGTKYWGGGLSLVGEHGPEIVRLPRGAEVLDNKNTQHILNARQNINNVTNLSKYISNRHALNRNIYNNNKSNTLSKSSSTFNKKVLDNRVNNKKSISNVKNGDVHITFTGDIHVRQESDIDAIATKIAQKLEKQQLNTA